jgi:hypothetical protein
MKRASLLKPAIPLLTVFLVLCLSGCQQDLALQDESGKIVGQGTLEITANFPSHLKHGHASFTADDGSKIECDIYYRGQPGAGSCDVAGKQLKLTVRQG